MMDNQGRLYEMKQGQWAQVVTGPADQAHEYDPRQGNVMAAEMHGGGWGAVGAEGGAVQVAYVTVCVWQYTLRVAVHLGSRAGQRESHGPVFPGGRVQPSARLSRSRSADLSLMPLLPACGQPGPHG
jgi:hypothetical protein